MTHFGFPFRVDSSGRTAGAGDEAHVKQLVEQLLFTAPGERINRPTFGTGLRQMIFSPLSDEIATAAQFTIQGALQQWLGDVIQVSEVEVEAVDSTLQVTVRYVLTGTGQPRAVHFRQEL